MGFLYCDDSHSSNFSPICRTIRRERRLPMTGVEHEFVARLEPKRLLVLGSVGNLIRKQGRKFGDSLQSVDIGQTLL